MVWACLFQKKKKKKKMNFLIIISGKGPLKKIGCGGVSEVDAGSQAFTYACIQHYTSLQWFKVI